MMKWKAKNLNKKLHGVNWYDRPPAEDNAHE